MSGQAELPAGAGRDCGDVVLVVREHESDRS